MVGYHIRQGHNGAVALDGLDCVYAAAWRNAIHEGNATATLFINEQASPAQRAALVEILTGRAGGEGPFALFSGCMLLCGVQRTPLHCLLEPLFSREISQMYSLEQNNELFGTNNEQPMRLK